LEASEEICRMTQNRISPLTATLVIRLPLSVKVPGGSYAVRNKTALLRFLLTAFRDLRMEFIYSGPKLLDIPKQDDGTTIVINVLQADERLIDNTVPRDILLKRFEKEIRYNSQHIIIDSGRPEKRLIEIYINNRKHQQVS
jgi:hypothetical protein